MGFQFWIRHFLPMLLPPSVGLSFYKRPEAHPPIQPRTVNFHAEFFPALKDFRLQGRGPKP